MSEILLPCECGDEPAVVRGPKLFAVGCEVCTPQAFPQSTIEEAEREWNLDRLREETCRCGQPVESLWQAGEPGATHDYFVLALCAECTTDDPYRSLCAFDPDPYEARRKWRELTKPVILCSVCGEGMRVDRELSYCRCDGCGRDVYPMGAIYSGSAIDYSLFA